MLNIDDPRVEFNTRKRNPRPKAVFIGCATFEFVTWLDILNVAIEHENYRFHRCGEHLRAVYEPESQWGHA